MQYFLESPQKTCFHSLSLSIPQIITQPDPNLPQAMHAHYLEHVYHIYVDDTAFKTEGKSLRIAFSKEGWSLWGSFYPVGQSLRGMFYPAGQSLRLTSPLILTEIK